MGQLWTSIFVGPSAFRSAGGLIHTSAGGAGTFGALCLKRFGCAAKASRFEWRELTADVEGKLERIDGNSRFTEITLRVRLVVPPGGDAARGRQLLEKAEKGCPVSNSLTATKHLEAEVVEAS